MRTAAPMLERVCIVMTSAIGDAVHVLPLVCAIKRHAPRAWITWVLQPGPAALVRGHPHVDEVIVFQRRAGWKAFLELRRELRGRPPFDVVLDLQVSFKAGLITWLAPAPVKLGFDLKRARDLTWLFTTHKLPPRGQRHLQDQFLEFLEPLEVQPAPLEWKLGPWPGEPTRSERLAGVRRPIVSLVIGTTNPEKDWLPERWAELIDRLDDAFSLHPVLVGGASPVERATEREISRLARRPPLSTLGCPLRELVAILNESALVVSLDTGPLHMAVALDRPVVSLMGYKDPRRVGPFRRFTDLVVDGFGMEDTPVTAATHPGGMKEITVAQVVQKVEVWRSRYASGVSPAGSGEPPPPR